MPLKPSVPGLVHEARLGLNRFFAWWRGELLGAWADWSLRKGERVQILCTDGELVLSRRLPSGFETLARTPCPPALSQLPELIRTLLDSQAQAFRYLEIVLPVEAVLSRRVHLPAAALHRLREAVGFQLERLLPLKSELVYFGCAVVSRDESQRRLLVEIVETRRSLADELVEGCLAVGIARVSLVSATDTAGRRAVSLLDRVGARTDTQRSPLDRWLAWTAVALAVAVAAVGMGQYHAENLRLEARMQALKVRANTADDIRDSLQSRIERIHFLAERVRGPDAAFVLAELTRLLPNDAWVFQYQAEGDQLHISGFAKDGSALSALLSKSALFGDVSLRSAVKAPGADGERFDIAIRVKAPVRS